jgi:hypothetical protein
VATKNGLPKTKAVWRRADGGANFGTLTTRGMWDQVTYAPSLSALWLDKGNLTKQREARKDVIEEAWTKKCRRKGDKNQQARIEKGPQQQGVSKKTEMERIVYNRWLQGKIKNIESKQVWEAIYQVVLAKGRDVLPDILKQAYAEVIELRQTNPQATARHTNAWKGRGKARVKKSEAD